MAMEIMEGKIQLYRKEMKENFSAKTIDLNNTRGTSVE